VQPSQEPKLPLGKHCPVDLFELTAEDLTHFKAPTFLEQGKYLFASSRAAVFTREVIAKSHGHDLGKMGVTVEDVRRARLSPGEFLQIKFVYAKEWFALLKPTPEDMAWMWTEFCDHEKIKGHVVDYMRTCKITPYSLYNNKISTTKLRDAGFKINDFIGIDDDPRRTFVLCDISFRDWVDFFGMTKENLINDLRLEKRDYASLFGRSNTTWTLAGLRLKLGFTEDEIEYETGFIVKAVAPPTTPPPLTRGVASAASMKTKKVARQPQKKKQYEDEEDEEEEDDDDDDDSFPKLSNFLPIVDPRKIRRELK